MIDRYQLEKNKINLRKETARYSVLMLTWLTFDSGHGTRCLNTRILFRNDYTSVSRWTGLTLKLTCISKESDSIEFNLLDKVRSNGKFHIHLYLFRIRNDIEYCIESYSIHSRIFLRDTYLESKTIIYVRSYLELR